MLRRREGSLRDERRIEQNFLREQLNRRGLPVSKGTCAREDLPVDLIKLSGAPMSGKTTILSDLSGGRKRPPLPVIGRDTGKRRLRMFSKFEYLPAAVEEGPLSTETVCCDCTGPCESGSCACADYERRINPQAQEIDWKFPTVRNCKFDDFSLVACGPMCSCDGNCARRKENLVIQPRLALFEHTDSRLGFGVLSAELIKQGSWVGEFSGVRRAKEEVSRRGKAFDYAFTICGEDGEGQKKSSNDLHVVIDCLVQGNWAKWLNHSCWPNLQVVRLVENLKDPRHHSVLLMATRDVLPNMELTLDYGPGYFADRKLTCLCGRIPCRDFPPTEKLTPQQIYSLLVKESQQLRELRKEEERKDYLRYLEGTTGSDSSQNDASYRSLRAAAGTAPARDQSNLALSDSSMAELDQSAALDDSAMSMEDEEEVEELEDDHFDILDRLGERATHSATVSEQNSADVSMDSDLGWNDDLANSDDSRRQADGVVEDSDSFSLSQSQPSQSESDPNQVQDGSSSDDDSDDDDYFEELNRFMTSSSTRLEEEATHPEDISDENMADLSMDSVFESDDNDSMSMTDSGSRSGREQEFGGEETSDISSFSALPESNQVGASHTLTNSREWSSPGLQAFFILLSSHQPGPNLTGPNLVPSLLIFLEKEFLADRALVQLEVIEVFSKLVDALAAAEAFFPHADRIARFLVEVIGGGVEEVKRRAIAVAVQFMDLSDEDSEQNGTLSILRLIVDTERAHDVEQRSSGEDGVGLNLFSQDSVPSQNSSDYSRHFDFFSDGQS